MIAAPNCPACGSTDKDQVFQEGAFTLWRCRACDLGWCDPLPDQSQLEASYTDAYQGASTGYFSKVKRKLQRSRGRVRDLARHLGPKALGSPVRFLDVGCNGGFMVQAAIEQGFDSYGLDADPVSIAYAKEHFTQGRFTHSFLEDYRARAGLEPDFTFDAIYCSEVIEHAPDPIRFIEALGDLAAPGAGLYLTTPDLGHFMVPRDLRKWDAYCPPDHCIYFSRGSLSRLMARVGFVPIKFRWAFKPGIKVLARKNLKP
jgi:SAM-dependent methyltransferase